MPTKFTVIATSQTAGITFLQLTVNNQNVSLSRDSGGNISGTKVMMLPDSFPAAVTIKALLPTDWTLSLNVETIPDKKSVLKQDLREAIGDDLEDHHNETLTLSPPAATAMTSMAIIKAKPKVKVKAGVKTVAKVKLNARAKTPPKAKAKTKKTTTRRRVP